MRAALCARAMCRMTIAGPRQVCKCAAGRENEPSTEYMSALSARTAMNVCIFVAWVSNCPHSGEPAMVGTGLGIRRTGSLSARIM